jgi:hypothetical protein
MFAHISSRMELPLRRFVEESTLLRNQMKTRQTTLSSFEEGRHQLGRGGKAELIQADARPSRAKRG